MFTIWGGGWGGFSIREQRLVYAGGSGSWLFPNMFVSVFPCLVLALL